MSKYGGEDVIYMNDGVFRNKLAIQDPLKFKKRSKETFLLFPPKICFCNPLQAISIWRIYRPFIANCLAMFMIGQEKNPEG